MMKSWVRFTAAALAVGVAVPLLGVVSPSPAAAASFDQIIDLWNYKILKSGTELQAAMGPAAQAAWGPETARVAARSTAAYNIAAATSGLTNVHPDPIYIRPQDLPQIKPSGAFKTYATKYSGVGLNKPTGVAGVAIAMTAFEYRAEIADGVTYWLGFDATDAVCADPTASGAFTNFLTGQDCAAWNMSAAAVAAANADAEGGASGGRICDPALPSRCMTMTATTTRPWLGSPYRLYRFELEGYGSTAPQLFFRKVGQLTGYSSAALAGGPAPGVGTTASISSCVAAWGVPAWCHFYGSNEARLSTYAPTLGQITGDSGASVVVVPSDPPRYFVCDYTGSNGQHYTANSGTFTEASGVTAPIVCPVLPSGVTSVHMKVTLVGGAQPLVMADEDVLPDPLGDGSQTNGVTTAYCGTNLCVLELMDLRSNKSCFDEGDACDGWLQSPTRDADYRCFYGGVQQDFKQCYVYAQVFNTAKRLAGEPYADPKTGEDTGTKSGLSIDELTMANSPRPAAFGRNCFGGDWGASNPVNWVLRPIQCALEWAFAARPAVVTANADVVNSAWKNTAPGEVVAVVGTWGFPAGSTGCAGPAVNIPFFGLSGYPLSACSGTLLAPMASAVKTMLSVMLVLGGAFVIVRMVSGVIGYRGIDE